MNPSRRELLKIAGLAAANLCIPSWLPEAKAQETTESLTAEEIEHRFPADRLPIILYHNPTYSSGGVLMNPQIFIAQMECLGQQGYHTLNTTELSAFLGGITQIPYKSVALRFDLGVIPWDEYENIVILCLRANNLHAIFYTVTGQNDEPATWDRLGAWYQEDLISLGSHSVSHPDFASINASQALTEARLSKQKIEDEFSQRGVRIEVNSFAFPYDSIPQDCSFLTQAGYDNAMVGRPEAQITANVALPGELVLPNLYPYTLPDILTGIQDNSQNNPLAIPLSWGNYSFDRLLFETTRQLTAADVEQQIGEPYRPLEFALYRALPPREYFAGRLVRPRGIVLHTDGQPMEYPLNWNSSVTYNGLIGNNGANVHFGVGMDGTTQFLEMYPHFITPTSGNGGAFFDHVGIEMGGNHYYQFDSGNAELRQAIETITDRTIDLIITLCHQYSLNPEHVYGHYEVSAKGKVDPGSRYMNEYFRPRLRERLSV